MIQPRAGSPGLVGEARRQVRCARVRQRESTAGKTRWAALCLVVSAVLVILSGCGPGPEKRFVPSTESAEQTLETALTAWQNGKKPPCLAQEKSPATPAIQLIDTHHKKDQRLAKFTVLGPTTGDATRCYAVRLSFENPSEEARARFVVLGLDPLWVMRYEDYEMVAHWDHPMPEKLPAKTTTP